MDEDMVSALRAQREKIEDTQHAIKQMRLDLAHEIRKFNRRVAENPSAAREAGVAPLGKNGKNTDADAD